MDAGDTLTIKNEEKPLKCNHDDRSEIAFTRKVIERMFEMHGPNIACILFATAAVLASGQNVVGQGKDESRLAVDTVSVKNQRQIRGFVLSASPVEDTVIAVSKLWLGKDDPALLAKTEVAAKQEATEARMQLRDRITALIEQPAEAEKVKEVRNGAIQFYLQRELNRMDAELTNPPDSDYQFVVLRVRPNSISNRNIANDANRRLAVWSWHERLVDVETRKPSSLASELKSKGIDFAEIPPDVSDRFYPTLESQDDWTVRMAIVNHRLNKSIEFQGSGDVMVSVRDGQKPDMASLMGQMMQSQMNALLKDLTSPSQKTRPAPIEDTEWVKAAVAKAEKMGERYFLATSVRMDLNGDAVIVEAVFMVRLDSEKWKLVFLTDASQTAAEQSDETLKRISNDPQIQSIQTQFQSLGGAGAVLDKSIRIGAATMSAQQLINEQFGQFTERYLKKLTSPRIQVAK